MITSFSGGFFGVTGGRSRLFGVTGGRSRLFRSAIRFFFRDRNYPLRSPQHAEVMSDGGLPPLLDPPSEEDLASAAAGDARARGRVNRQNSRVRARERERAAWIASRKAMLAVAAGNVRGESNGDFSFAPSPPPAPSSAASSRAHSPSRTAPSPPPASSPPSSRHSSPFR